MTANSVAVPDTRVRPRAGVVLASALLAVALGYPTFLLITTAFNVGDPFDFPAREYGLEKFAEVGDHLHWLYNTFAMATSATVIALVCGIVLAWIIHRTTTPGAQVFELLIAIPYPLGPLVCALAWLELGAPQGGVINRLYRHLTGAEGALIDVTSLWGITFVLALSEIPVAVLMIGAAMQRMDPSLEECGSVFGASTFRTAARITIPLMAPAILSTALFLFTSMLGAFAIPTILGTNSQFYVATTAIFVLFQGYPPNYPLAAAIGLILVGVTCFAVWLNAYLLAGRSYTVISGKNYRPRRIDMGRFTIVLFAIVCVFVLLMLVLPIGILLFASLQHTSEINWAPGEWTLANYVFVLVDFPNTRQAIVNSITLGIVTGAIGIIFATVLVWLVQRGTGPGRGALEQLVMLPQAFPRLIFAFALLWTMLSLPVRIYGTFTAVLVTYLLVFLPLAYRSMSGVMVQIHPSLEEAARVSGAGWGRTMSRITLPLLRPGLVATWALVFMVSVREVSASVFLASSSIPVLGPAILSFWDSGGLPRVSALALVQAFIIFICMIVVRRLTHSDVRAV